MCVRAKYVCMSVSACVLGPNEQPQHPLALCFLHPLSHSFCLLCTSFSSFSLTFTVSSDSCIRKLSAAATSVDLRSFLSLSCFCMCV